MYELNTVDDVAVLDLNGEVSHSEMTLIESILGKLMNTKKTKWF